ncbi:hypothetical protein GCM10010961_14780 [Pseudodonghicola xiamenensis]|uniref:Acetyltransferase (GNAT) domain-containing protein n=1 Tax=Pseudodonghicola xiamenensis TaxID=337702 RepID=A0A8J3MBR8_9RHOB|nr:hypothetical protein GCM10010961_14780 [Pseudodonghicola xiamenensis]
MSDVILRPFHPEDATWLVARHQELYARDEGFDASFGPLVAGILDEFIADHDPERERGWIAEEAGTRLGSIFCVDAGQGAGQAASFDVHGLCARGGLSRHGAVDP